MSIWSRQHHQQGPGPTLAGDLGMLFSRARVLKIHKMIRVGRLEETMILGRGMEALGGLLYEKGPMLLQVPRKPWLKVVVVARAGLVTRMAHGGKWVFKTGCASIATTTTLSVTGNATGVSALSMNRWQGTRLVVYKHLAGSKARTISTRVHILHWISSCGVLNKAGDHMKSPQVLGTRVALLFLQGLGQHTKGTGALEAHLATRVKEVKDKFNRVTIFRQVHKYHRVFQYLYLQVYLKVLFHKVHRVLTNLRVYKFLLACRLHWVLFMFQGCAKSSG